MSASIKTFVGGYTFKIVTASDMNPSEKDWHIIAMFYDQYLVTDMHPDDVEKFSGGVPELLLRALADELVADYGPPYRIGRRTDDTELLWVGDEQATWFKTHLIESDDDGPAWVDHIRAAQNYDTIAEAMFGVRQILADVQEHARQHGEVFGFELRLYDAQERPIRDFQPSYASWHAQWSYDGDGRQVYTVLP